MKWPMTKRSKPNTQSSKLVRDGSLKHNFWDPVIYSDTFVSFRFFVVFIFIVILIYLFLFFN